MQSILQSMQVNSIVHQCQCKTVEQSLLMPLLCNQHVDRHVRNHQIQTKPITDNRWGQHPNPPVCRKCKCHLFCNPCKCIQLYHEAHTLACSLAVDKQINVVEPHALACTLDSAKQSGVREQPLSERGGPNSAINQITINSAIDAEYQRRWL